MSNLLELSKFEKKFVFCDTADLIEKSSKPSVGVTQGFGQERAEICGKTI